MEVREVWGHSREDREGEDRQGEEAVLCGEGFGYLQEVVVSLREEAEAYTLRQEAQVDGVALHLEVEVAESRQNWEVGDGRRKGVAGSPRQRAASARLGEGEGEAPRRHPFGITSLKRGMRISSRSKQTHSLTGKLSFELDRG